MELNIKDRIYIPQMLPGQNSFMEFNMKRGIVKKVALTSEDIETYNIQENKEEGRITWDVQKDAEIPLVVDFSKEELNYLQKACEKLYFFDYRIMNGVFVSCAVFLFLSLLQFIFYGRSRLLITALAIFILHVLSKA